ncbi:MAG: cellulase family glycosylhydrolase, partial [Solirubrobacteraceae bacterium]
ADGWAGAGIVSAPGGPYMVDAFGRRLQLHGANLVAKCGGGAIPTAAPGTPCVGPPWGDHLAYVLSPTAADPGRRFTAADAATLAGLGFNVVRLGIIWEGLEPGPPGSAPNDPRYCAPHRRGTPFPALGRADPYDPATVRAYLRRTDVIVRLLQAAGIRVIVDMHSDAFGSAFSDHAGPTPWNGEGAPPWATCYGRRRFIAPTGWGSAYNNRTVQIAIHHFWANDVRADLQAQYARVWRAVARHFRGDPEVLGYEIANEPNDYLVRSFDPELQCDYGGSLREPRSCARSGAAALPEGMIGAIRAADPGHVVLYEPSGSTNVGAPETIGIAEPLRFSDLALAFHVYGPVMYELRLTARERAATRTLRQPGGPAWIMDEFGASGNVPQATATVSDAERLHLSWAYWSAFQLHDPTAGDATEALIDDQTRVPYRGLATATAVPYQWAVAGTPGPQSFDRATRTFRCSYTVDASVHAPTEVELPAYTYPDGYAASVRGAAIESAPDAPLLLLRALPGARTVSLTVRPRSTSPAGA